jgi:hypothetical protein
MEAERRRRTRENDAEITRAALAVVKMSTRAGREAVGIQRTVQQHQRDASADNEVLRAHARGLVSPKRECLMLHRRSEHIAMMSRAYPGSRLRETDRPCLMAAMSRAMWIVQPPNVTTASRAA